jgi:DNA-nicking Smr family endonuclease
VPPLPLQRWADDRKVLGESLERTVDWDFDRQTGESLAYKREGVQLQVFRRLRRGHWVVQAELDLHGFTREEARAELVAFLADCLRQGLRCVRVIHGKGLGSRNREPVLKAKVAGWLAQRESVLAFCEAPPRDGGGGAVLVLLRADSPVSPVRMRIAWATSYTKIFPSPILPVRAARAIASRVASSRLSGTTTSIFTLGRKSIAYSAPR